jgi:hypothetical protein
MAGYLLTSRPGGVTRRRKRCSYQQRRVERGVGQHERHLGSALAAVSASSGNRELIIETSINNLELAAQPA